MAQTDSTPTLLDHVQLSSGRHLSYATYGARGGVPVFIFHGFPGSRFEGALWQETAVKLNICLIVPDRPGAGFSSFQPGRRISDWPGDVQELAAHLKIGQFHILSMGVGSAYAFACLRTIPRDQLRGASIVSGSYPLSIGAEDMMLRPRIILFIARWFTSFLAFVLDLALGRPARAKDPTAFEAAMEPDHKTRSDIDQAILQGEFKARYTNSVRESFRAGSYGVAWDARLFGSDWGFDLDTIDGSGVTIWHGKYDNIHPISMAQRAAGRIHGASFKALDEGHLSLPARHMDEILGELVKLEAV